MTQQPPEQPAPQAVAAPPAPAAPETGKAPPWGDKPENFDATKAWELIQNLRAEKSTPDPQIKAELDGLKKQQEDQRAALAKALGLAPDEASQADKLTETVTTLQRQFAEQQLKATRLEVAAANQIPAEFQGWLTATDPAGLDAQAKQLVPMVQATLAARGLAPLAGAMPGQPIPAFQPIPGQGQNGAPTPQQQQAAGYAEFYDEHGRPRS